MAAFRYRHSGCLVESELELPEWQAFAVRDGTGDSEVEPDIVIRLEPALPAAPPLDHVPEVDGESVSFCVPDTGSWRITSGREIAVAPMADADPIALRLFTLGTGWGVLGYQRGWAMLHGSAVMGPRGAVLFCGWQGAGKSTMAAALAERGLPLVGDDLSRVVPGRADRGTSLYPSSTRHKLWRDAIEGLGLSDREQVRDHMQTDKFHLFTERHVPLDRPVPLVGIYALEFGGSLGIERLKGGGAARSVLRQTVYRPRFLKAMGKLSEQAVYAAQIAATVPVFKLTRPPDLTQINRVCERLIAHMENG